MRGIIFMAESLKSSKKLAETRKREKIPWTTENEKCGENQKIGKRAMESRKNMKFFTESRKQTAYAYNPPH